MKFDLLIQNAQVIDGTGQPAYRADIAVTGKRIAAIGQPNDGIFSAQSQKTINADKLAVMPGIIDPHSHADLILPLNPEKQAELMRCKLAQGITTTIVGNCGLGCAPVVGAIQYIFRRREQYGAVKILHGVKTPHDLLYRERFDRWRRSPNTEVLLTSDKPDKTWRYHIGVVTELFEAVNLDPHRTMVLMCGPEIMMRLGVPILRARGIPATAIYVSLERHMECGIGLCGHCQMGPYFLCKDGPVMRFDRIEPFMGREGV